MPELPEVETIRRDLLPHLVGARILSVWTSGKPLHMNRPIDVRALRRARGQILALRRHGKYLTIDVEGGSVIVHLGMSGSLSVTEPGPKAAHTHVVWRLDTGRELRYVDPRRFGQVTTRPPEDVGIDPFDRTFTVARFSALLARSKRAVKPFLLDQSQVAGIGNIYASEALFSAGIHPDSRADRLGEDARRALWRAVRDVLAAGIRNRGTTLRNYRDGKGREGRNQRRLRVYGRDGEPCVRCGGVVRRSVHQGRATYFCPTCQIRPTR
ncbi:MAG TPA: bifunctional DNA-formamidopyrimidine glycosylase/DNA-(apurinic or apyrimidinic site) lyase [Haliangiales bacterium]|nr:bifunctional DNA-formamidopyrimidine glycosylase/DNA-(apurinic or apyrimidinic site) lyase [Haliangiales bacterium]